MSITILGAGNMGRGLAKLAIESGWDVVVGARDPAKAKQLAAELGAKARSADIAGAVSSSDFIVLAITYDGVASALEAAGDLSGKVIVDITNPLSPDYMSLTVGHSTSAAEEIAKLAPGAHVVKAFNTIFAQLLPREVRRDKSALQVFTAADNEPARRRVEDFIAKAGFEPVNAGPLKNARFIEPVAELNIHFGYALGWGTATAPSWTKLAA
jgi:predicted dinucleotide-binding enzyme